MKALIVYLLTVFALLCALLAIVTIIDPYEPPLAIEGD